MIFIHRLCFYAQKMHNSYWRVWSVSLCVCVYVSQSNHFVVWMCPGFICIWRWVHSRGWILRDLFCNPEPRDARASAFCLAHSANPSSSPAKSHQLLCVLFSRLFSHFLYLSQRPIQFLFTSLFLSVWLARMMLWVSHIWFVLNGLWPSHSWVPVFLHCFFSLIFHYLSQHVHMGPVCQQQAPRKLCSTLCGVLLHLRLVCTRTPTLHALYVREEDAVTNATRDAAVMQPWWTGSNQLWLTDEERSCCQLSGVKSASVELKVLNLGLENKDSQGDWSQRKPSATLQGKCVSLCGHISRTSSRHLLCLRLNAI